MTGPFILRNHGSASDPVASLPILGQYLKSFRDTPDGRGFAEYTADPMQALQFKTQGDAFEFVRQQSKTKSKRADGKANRPLTSCHMEILPLLMAVESKGLPI